MTITISTELLTAQVLAYTAMRHHNSGGVRPALNGDRSEAINRLATSAFGIVCAHLTGILTDCNIDAIAEGASGGESDDILRLDLVGNAGINPVLFRLTLERALFSHIMADVLAESDHEASARFEAEFTDLVERMRRSASPGTGAAQISRYPY